MGGSGSKKKKDAALNPVAPSSSQGQQRPPPKNNKEKLARAEESLVEEKQNLDRLKSEKEEARKRVGVATQQEQQLQANLLQARDTSGALRPPIDAATSRKSALSADSAAAHKEIAKMEADIAAEMEVIRSTQARVDRTLDKRAGFKQALEEFAADSGAPPLSDVAKEAAESAIRALKVSEEELLQLEQELAALEAETAELRSQHSMDTEELAGLQPVHAELQKQAAEAEVVLHVLEDSSRDLQAKVFEATEKVLKHEVETEHLSHALERATSELESRRSQLKRLGSMYQHEVDPVKDVLVDTTSRKRQADILHAQRVAEIESSARSHVASLNIQSPQIRPAITAGAVGQLVVGVP